MDNVSVDGNNNRCEIKIKIGSQWETDKADLKKEKEENINDHNECGITSFNAKNYVKSSKDMFKFKAKISVD